MRRSSTVVVMVAALALLAGCTPAQFQRWWTERGNAPLQEPALSQMAALATDYWTEEFRKARFQVNVQPIDAVLAARMTPSSWRPGCPVPLSELRYIQASFMGFDGSEQIGEIVVHRDAALVTVALLKAMWEQRFPLDRMRLVDDYGGSDDASIAANNTSAFNCRAATGGSNWSQHSYGRAIDINPVQNPYVTSSIVLPASGAAYLDRGNVRPGMIVPGSIVWNVVKFVKWGWGGDWSSLKDYQHVSPSGR